jgi:MFS family permease
MTHSPHPPPLGAATALRVFLPFAIGYYFSYLVRNVNAVIAPDLVAELGLTAESLGLLTSVYFLTFAAFQLPLGVLLDRYGPRRVESALLLCAAAGSALFAASDGIAGLTVGRALIGLGVSACLMASFKANTLWFPPEKLPFVNGCIMTAGGLGALSATAPVEALLGVTGWRGVFVLFTALSGLAAVVLFMVVPRRPEESRDVAVEGLAQALAGVRRVFTSRAFWRVVPMSTLNQAAFLAMQGLWAGPWFIDVAGMERDEAARQLLWIALAMVAGFFTLGAFTERLARRGVSTVAVATALVVVFLAVQAGIVFAPVAIAAPLWIAFGYFGTCGILHLRHPVLRPPHPGLPARAVGAGRDRAQRVRLRRRLRRPMGHGCGHRAVAGRGGGQLQRRGLPGGFRRRPRTRGGGAALAGAVAGASQLTVALR